MPRGTPQGRMFATTPVSGAILAGLRHFSCLIFVGGLLRHYLGDDEDNEIGFRTRDCRARRGVPWEPLGGIGGGKGKPLVSGLRRSFRIAT
jgi:hypothetical protein